MMKSVTLLAAAATLSGCVPALVYGGSRGEVRTTAAEIIAERRPDLDSTAAASCIVKGMSVQEVIVMGNNNIKAITAADRAKVDEVMTRPGVAACLGALPKTQEKA